MTPKEAMNQVRSAMDLKWTSNDDAKQAEGLIAQLSEEIVEPAHLLRLAQTLWVEPTDPAGRKRACMQWLLNRMQDSGLTLLSDSESGPSWAQSIVWSALRIHTEQHAKGAGLFIRSASAAEWVSIDERFKQLIEELISISQRKEMDEPLHPAGPTREPMGGAMLEFGDAPNKKKIDNFIETQMNAGNVANIQNLYDVIRSSNKIHFGRSAALAKQVNTMHEAIAQLDKDLPLATDVSKSAHETNILWWGQALYSPSLLRSYRDMDSSSQLLWMAEDLAYLANQHPSGPTTAFFSETLRRLNPNIDQRHPLRQHISDFIQAAQNKNNKAPSPLPLLQPYLGEDLTGLPFSFALQQAQSHASTASILDAITQKTGLPLDKEVSTRTFAQWLFRERSLIHWLSAKSSST